MTPDRSVLLVEDEDLIREIAAEELEVAGYVVVAVRNGLAAMDALDERQRPFCAVITDIDLGPGPDGWAVARHCREQDDVTPIVYVTGGGGRDWSTQSVAGSVLLMKPYTPQQMVGAVTRLVSKAEH